MSIKHLSSLSKKACVIPFLAVFLMGALNNGLDGDFFYDESVYANLASHPFFSDYYRDPVFFRHPPFVYMFYFLLGRIPGAEGNETVYRAASLLFASGGIILFWFSLLAFTRSFPVALAALAGLVLSPLFLRYGISSTMYPFFFFFLQLTLVGIAGKSRALKTAGFVLLVNTHYMGFVLLFLYFLSLVVKGTSIREALRKNRSILLLISPLTVLIAVGMIYHAARSDISNFKHNCLALAYYVPLAGWLSLYPLLRIRKLAEKSATEIFFFFTASFFVIVYAFTPAFPRYIYLVLPVMLLLAARLVGEATAGMRGGMKPAAVILSAAMFMLPLPLASFVEPFLFNDYYADNSRFQGWRRAAALCGDHPVVTNNARSYLYYKAQIDGRRYNLASMEEQGALAQFEIPFLEGFKKARQRIRPPGAGCIVINSYPCLAAVDAYIEDTLTECRPVSNEDLTKVFICKAGPRGRLVAGEGETP